MILHVLSTVCTYDFGIGVIERWRSRYSICEGAAMA